MGQQGPQDVKIGEEDWLLLHYDVAASVGGFSEARRSA